MTQGAPWRHILCFAMPVLCGSLLQQLYHTADTLIVGNFLGENALAAVGTTNTFAFLFLAVAIGFSAGNGVLVAQHFGADDEKMVRKDAATGILLLCGMGVVFSVAGAVLSRPVYAGLIAVPQVILDDTVKYFQIYSAGLLFQFGFNIFASVLRAVGDSAATLYFLLLSSLLNIALDLFFIAVCHSGVAGVAWATVISQAVSMAALWIYMSHKYHFFRYRLNDLTWDRHIAVETLVIGFPIALQLVIVAVGLSFIQRAVNGFGKVMTASFTVGQRIEMYLHLPCNALQATLATYTGQNVGAGQMERVKSGALQGVLISVGFTALLAVAVWFAATWISEIFGLSELAEEYCAAHLKAVAFITVILSVYVPLFGVFQGTKHCITPAVVALGALTLRVIVTYLFKDSAYFGRSIIWWNGLFGFCTGCIITWSCYLSGRWQKNPLGNLNKQ